jgi:hypothetical protein|tara:strand:- start:597 stop:794 length:198 start_codon:yes stop_codon:yes gene_type:complete
MTQLTIRRKKDMWTELLENMKNGKCQGYKDGSVYNYAGVQELPPSELEPLTDELARVRFVEDANM